jgi:hypothetical protein
MAGKKVVSVRFYPDTDADLIKWLEGLAVGEGNDTIKARLRTGIAASSAEVHSTQPAAAAFMATLDPASMEAALENFLPRIREVMDAALASAQFARTDNKIAEDENSASPDILKGHLIGDDEED